MTKDKLIAEQQLQISNLKRGRKEARKILYAADGPLNTNADNFTPSQRKLLHELAAALDLDPTHLCR